MSNNWNHEQLQGFENPAWSDSLQRQLTNLQNNLIRLGLRQERYATTIRQALSDGRLRMRQIDGDLSTGLQALQERLAARGLGRGGAIAQLGRDLERQAAQAERENNTATQQRIAQAGQQISNLELERQQRQQETARLLRQGLR